MGAPARSRSGLVTLSWLKSKSLRGGGGGGVVVAEDKIKMCLLTTNINEENKNLFE